jgi:hypothetical protein
MNYSICYLKSDGCTERSEFLPFESDASAVRYANSQMRTAALVEVWKGDALLVRLDRAAQTAEKHSSWENEGGALRV